MSDLKIFVGKQGKEILTLIDRLDDREKYGTHSESNFENNVHNCDTTFWARKHLGCSSVKHS